MLLSVICSTWEGIKSVPSIIVISGSVRFGEWGRAVA
jgi:hypothetical protein